MATTAKTKTPDVVNSDLVARIDQAIMAARTRRSRHGYSEGLPVHQIRKAIRVQSGLTGQDLADVIGVRRERIYQWEADANPRDLDTCRRYAEALCILSRREKEAA